MEGKPLFLDTSIQISRKSGDETETSKIEDFLNQHNFLCTSSYVRLEFKQSFIQDLRFLHRELFFEKSFIRVFSRVRRMNAHPGHKRKITNILTALLGWVAKTKSFHSDDNLDKDLAEHIELYLELVLENIWNWFEKSVIHISDCTGCLRAKEPPKKKMNVFDVRVGKCKSTKIRCKLNKFFKEKEKEFNGIKDYIRKLDESEKKNPKELEGLALTIEEGLKSPDVLCETQNCRKLGDALIAVEAKHFKKLFTKDTDQAKVICEPIALECNLLV